MLKRKKTSRLPPLSAWRQRLAHLPLSRWFLLLFTCLLCALLMVDYVQVPDADYDVGDVAPYDMRSPTTFSYVDWERTRAQQAETAAGVPPVFDLDATLSGKLKDRVTLAFDVARRKLQDAASGDAPPPKEALARIGEEFLVTLDFAIDDDYVGVLLNAGFPEEVEALAKEFISVMMRRHIIADRAMLPGSADVITVIRLVGDVRQESRISDLSSVITVEAARQELALYALEHDNNAMGADLARAAQALARAAVRPNFSYNQLLTEERRREAASSVPQVVIPVKEGTNLFRAGDVLTVQHVEKMRALQQSHSGAGTLGGVLSLLAFCTLVVGAFHVFAVNHVRRFTRNLGNLLAMAFLLVLMLALARATLEVSGGIFGEGDGPLPSSLWYIVPVAGAAMLVRILANGETALVFAVVASLLTGVALGQDVYYALFFLISSVVAVRGIAHTKERLQVLRAGLLTALVNAVLVLLIALVYAYLGSGPQVATGAFLWSAIFAALGGVISAVLVLGLIPFFEIFGFVTDYKLLEMANLNHPLLRQLMLRAPGTYHHSVMVGSLSEAAAEAIGADTLMVRVASYFHDVGKIHKPGFYVENQRDMPNPHDRLSPLQSATIILRHVAAGERIARDNRLPQPIIDGILMHHGTGLMTYFYERARQAAGEHEVDETLFRYPGPKPDTREAGILHLADKVEAACRSIKHPDPEKLRAMIETIVSGAMNDGQLSDCPLTLKDLYTITKSFADVLGGIYHQRVEYPDRDLNGDARAGVITLEILNPLGGSAHDGPGLEEQGEFVAALGGATSEGPGELVPPAAVAPPEAGDPDEDEEAMSGEFQEMADLPPDLTEER